MRPRANLARQLILRGLLAAMLWILAGTAAAAVSLFELNAPHGALVSPAYFGLHVHHLVKRGLPQDPPQPTPWPGADIGSLRLWDSSVRWAELEPRPGQWRFERLDAYVAAATKQGVPLIYTLGSTPTWASARPGEPCSYGMGCAAEPADLVHWDRYVAAVARRYKGQIAWYEVWNEPHPGQSFPDKGFYNGSTEMLVTLARRARAVLQREDPEARLLTPAFVNREGELERFLAQGGAALVQGVAYHFYASGETQLLERFSRIQASRQRHGLMDLPLFNTESAFEVVPPERAGSGYPARDAEQTAALNARAWILGTVMGLAGWYHHGWDSRLTGMVDREGGRTPTGMAWRTVRRWLVGAQPLRCRSMVQGIVQCSFQTRAGPLWVLWQPGAAAQPRAVALPAAWRAERFERLLGSEDATAQAVPELLEVGGAPVAVWGATPTAARP